jgi:hypothetical protein
VRRSPFGPTVVGEVRHDGQVTHTFAVDADGHITTEAADEPVRDV